MDSMNEKKDCGIESSGMRTFESIVKEYAESKKNESIPNSTTEHAYIGIKYLFKNATGTVRILTRGFFPQFWSRLEEDFKIFLTPNANNKVEVIAIDDISTNQFACNLRKQYSARVMFSQLNLSDRLKEAFGSANDFPHFLVIEPVGYRFEVSDKDKEKSLVEGIINFGDAEGTAALAKAFGLLKDKATKPVLLVG